MEDKTYIDDDGYKRFKDSDKLVHRWIALNKIYLPNKHKYRFPFSKYVVHHIDLNKLNNDVSNLEIITQNEHEDIHGITDTEIERINARFRDSDATKYTHSKHEDMLDVSKNPEKIILAVCVVLTMLFLFIKPLIAIIPLIITFWLLIKIYSHDKPIQ